MCLVDKHKSSSSSQTTAKITMQAHMTQTKGEKKKRGTNTKLLEQNDGLIDAFRLGVSAFDLLTSQKLIYLEWKAQKQGEKRKREPMSFSELFDQVYEIIGLGLNDCFFPKFIAFTGNKSGVLGLYSAMREDMFDMYLKVLQIAHDNYKVLPSLVFPHQHNSESQKMEAVVTSFATTYRTTLNDMQLQHALCENIQKYVELAAKIPFSS
jgi:hypothetical protein